MEAFEVIFRKGSWRIFQCKTDAFLIGFSEDNIEDCIEDREAYDRLWPTIYSEVKRPGYFTNAFHIQREKFELFLPGVTRRYIATETGRPVFRLAIQDRAEFARHFNNDKMQLKTQYDCHLLFYVPFE